MQNEPVHGLNLFMDDSMSKKLVSIYLEPTQVKQLEKLRESGYSASALIRKFLTEGLAKMAK